ncbi:Rieske 2Fe-2S domain-containing protein [Mycobacterium avium]|uniref:Rieske 2Fe-2S domain-containing protein n=1 Tax=Mycobacterium avium TaxID=1764 RepID=UPI001CC51B6E|nr:Rieske 2Fe-2S domain-containing protein [Mycobacterium avium]
MTEYPDGWYWACFSEQLRRKKVRPVTYMGQRFALMRTAGGRPAMLSAQCCHMGADLARSGKVKGERLVCGYHGWEFGTGGACELMPEMERIPKNARQRSLPLTETAGNVWFWWGAGPPAPFVDVGALNSRQRFLTLRGEVHTGHGGPLPIMEHVADIYHFPNNHRSSGQLEYNILHNAGPQFEFQLRPAHGTAPKIQTLFAPWAFVEMAGPCSAIYRTQSGPEVDRDSALLTIVLGVTPVRDGETVFTWRVFGKRFLGRLSWPIDRLFTRLLWFIIRRNVPVDLEVLKWMDPPEHTLWVKPDGDSVRQFRSFYERNIAAEPGSNESSRHRDDRDAHVV